MKTKRIFTPRLIAVCAAVVLVLALATAAYAADVGGIRRTVQVWIHGDQTDAVFEVEDGSYTLTYQDENGNTRERMGGGVADGRPMTADELLAHLDAPEIIPGEDGRIRLYWRDQALDITDDFDDGVCRVMLVSGGETLYLTAKLEGSGVSYSISPHSYPKP